MKKVKYHTRVRYEPNMEVKTLGIDLIFIFKKDLDHAFDLNLIKRMVKTTANGFENDADFTNELQRRLIIDMNVNLRDMGNISLLRFSLTIPKKDLVKGYSMDDAIEFFKKAIFNPFAADGRFNDERFTNEKEGLRINYINSRDSVYVQADRRFMKYVDPEQKISRSYEDNLKLIEDATSETVYQYYKEIVLDNNYLLYIGGCADEETANYIYETYFKQEEEEFEVTLDYFDFFKPTKEVYYEEKHEFNQSALFMEYRVDGLTVENSKYYSMLNNILSTTENDLIFKALRVDNNLVYGAYTNRLAYNGIFYIDAYLSKENKDKAIQVVKDVFERLKDKDFTLKCMNKLKRGIELDLIRDLDSKYQKLESLIYRDLHIRRLEDLVLEYKDITVDDLIHYISNVRLNNVLFIEGDKDGKD